MKQWQILRTVFPEIITDNFEFTDYRESSESLEYWLEERDYMSREDYKKAQSILMVLPSIKRYRISPWAWGLPACPPSQMDRPFHRRDIHL